MKVKCHCCKTLQTSLVRLHPKSWVAARRVAQKGQDGCSSEGWYPAVNAVPDLAKRIKTSFKKQLVLLVIDRSMAQLTVICEDAPIEWLVSAKHINKESLQSLGHKTKQYAGLCIGWLIDNMTWLIDNMNVCLSIIGWLNVSWINNIHVTLE